MVVEEEDQQLKRMLRGQQYWLKRGSYQEQPKHSYHVAWTISLLKPSKRWRRNTLRQNQLRLQRKSPQ